MHAMPAGLPTAILLFAQATSYGPATQPAPEPAPVAAAKPDECAQRPGLQTNEIVICAVKPDGYRIDPDLMTARRQKKQGLGSRPRSPHETYADKSCATVGPMGCRGAPAVNLLAAALVAGQIANRLAKGQEVGSMFKSDPQMSEYELYQQAKKQREAKETDDAAKALAEAARAAAKR
jgi:hypothetical protein